MEPSDERAGYCGGEVRSIFAQIRVAQIRLAQDYLRVLYTIHIGYTIGYFYYLHCKLLIFNFIYVDLFDNRAVIIRLVIRDRLI